MPGPPRTSFAVRPPSRPFRITGNPDLVPGLMPFLIPIRSLTCDGVHGSVVDLYDKLQGAALSPHDSLDFLAGVRHGEFDL